MARKIQDAEEATQAPSEPQAEGVAFVKNQTNEIIYFGDGTNYRFQKSREFITSPELIEKLRAVADRYQIIEQQ